LAAGRDAKLAAGRADDDLVAVERVDGEVERVIEWPLGVRNLSGAALLDQAEGPADPVDAEEVGDEAAAAGLVVLIHGAGAGLVGGDAAAVAAAAAGACPGGAVRLGPAQVAVAEKVRVRDREAV